MPGGVVAAWARGRRCPWAVSEAARSATRPRVETGGWRRGRRTAPGSVKCPCCRSRRGRSRGVSASSLVRLSQVVRAEPLWQGALDPAQVRSGDVTGATPRGPGSPGVEADDVLARVTVARFSLSSTPEDAGGATTGSRCAGLRNPRRWRSILSAIRIAATTVTDWCGAKHLGRGRAGEARPLPKNASEYRRYPRPSAGTAGRRLL